MGNIFLLSLTAALNPTLVGASTVMMLLPNAKRLMLGYLCGALLTSVTLGLVIVNTLDDSSAVSTTQNSISPAVDLALGAILLVAALVLRSRRDRRREAREHPPEVKEPPRWQRALRKGSARTTFVVGALLTLPGGSYLAGLHHIAEQNLSTASTTLVVIGFNIVMMALLEAPLLSYTLAPEWTPGAVERAKGWAARNGDKAAVIALSTLGAALIVKGLVEIIA
jgi:Sap, sulfolipid-1-addressing protein